MRGFIDQESTLQNPEDSMWGLSPLTSHSFKTCLARLSPTSRDRGSRAEEQPGRPGPGPLPEQGREWDTGPDEGPGTVEMGVNVLSDIHRI